MLGPDDPAKIEYRLNFVDITNHPLSVGLPDLKRSAQQRADVCAGEQCLLWRFTAPRNGGHFVAGAGQVEIGIGGEESKAPSAKSEPLRGKVAFVGLDVDRKSDAGLVRVALPAKAGIPSGQFVRIRIVVEERQNRLVVPRESVVHNAEGKDVIVGFLGEKAIMKEVRVGIREGDLVEIEGEEIDEGDVVVIQGAYGLPGEAKIRIEGKK
jgi:hypothetical protein